MNGIVTNTAAILFMVATACFNGSAAETAADRLGWQLTIHSYTFQKFPIFDAIDETAALGVQYMSLSGGLILQGTNRVDTLSLSPGNRAAIKKKLREAGIIKLVNLGVVKLPADESQSRKVFEFAREMGIDTLVSEPEPEAMDTVEKLCKQYGMKVAIHNHPKPSRYWNPDTVLAAVKGRSPLLGACADTGHWQRSGLDPVECLKKLDGRVITLHFKDLAERDPKSHDVPWGTGSGSAKAMLQELKRQNFKGPVCVEYEYHWENSSPEIAECVKFFNKTCEELVRETN